ncbi:phosphatidylinositol 3-kinase catalytic subunit type 3-like isoform X2 [Planococcus citri]|uniref:phosphatidylinositol 3-kinase catalytic subunit type 3-like isoform X2 n=1 Tax=Planococcus citri TaxID=170843 RepID=UPI0031FA0D5B
MFYTREVNAISMDQQTSSFSYIYSYSLQTNVQIKIGSLEGNHLKASKEEILKNYELKFSGLFESECADLMVICRVYSDGVPLCLPVSSSYKAFSTRWNWSEWITLPIMFSHLPRNALLVITIYDCVGASEMRPVGSTTISLFGKRGVFRKGMMDLQVWPFKQADGTSNTSTPGKPQNDDGQMYCLGKLTKKYRSGLMPTVDWLDRLTFREIEVINEREKKNSDFMYLMVEFPEVVINDTSYHIVYYEEEGDDVIPCRTQADIVTIPDTEISLDNLVENKHHKLARSLRSGISDKDAKPNATVRDQLNTIVGYPPTKQLTTEEQDLIWKFRFYLKGSKKASIKFLECVNWKLPAEVRQALDMLAIWEPMDVEDALRLLSPSFQHPSMRKYAVTRLKQASDEDLHLYLLQLVQALRYENFEDINSKYKYLSDLVTSKDTSAMETLSSASTDTTTSVLSTASYNNNAEVMQYYKTIFDNSSDMDLATFLIYRACRNFNLANYFYWYLMVECENCESSTVKQDNSTKNMYLTVRNTFLLLLQNGSTEMQKKYSYLKRQKTFINKLVQLVKNVAREKANRKNKIEHLRSLLKDTETLKFNFSDFEPLPFPLDPTIYIKGIVPDKATLFNSALMPSKLTFISTNYTEYVTIFKHGDDLRQDQLVLQIVTLMDKLLRSENLDLKLTPYRVLAVSIKHGFVQFVKSVPVAEVLKTEGSIQNFFRKHHPNENGPYGISADIMDTYVKSCAGYCVITYLLGVGDRHFDNLLLTTTGKLFHIDFGYILGRDPKPLPPPMKLSKEMVEAMGGVTSEHYHEFRKLCYTAFLHLRRHSNLILNLFTLMVDASVPDIALEPDKAVMKVQDKFRLDLGDEEAVHYLQNLIDMSVTAVMAALVEQLHKFAQYWRT